MCWMHHSETSVAMFLHVLCVLEYTKTHVIIAVYLNMVDWCCQSTFSA